MTDAPGTTVIRLADAAHDGESDAVSFQDTEAAVAGSFNDMEEDVPASSSTTTSSPLPPPPSQHVSAFFVGHARGNLEADTSPSFVPPISFSHHSTDEAAARYLVLMDEENTRTLFCDDWRGDDERTLGEVEDDDAPQPPELISESFERRWDEEDDRAPLPPDVIAASFEAVKPELIGDDGAPVPDPEEQIAASFEGRGDDEEEREEVEDECAPLPPETIAAAYKANDAADQEAAKRTGYHRLILPVNCTNLHEVVDNDETHAATSNQGSPLNPSSSSNQQHSTTIGVRVGAFSVSPTPLRGDEQSLPPPNSGQCRVVVTISPNLESTSPRPNIHRDHSVPLLEARLVPDVPDEPVYDAYPMPDTQENVARRGWSKKRLYTTLGLGSLVFVAMATLLIKFQGDPTDEDLNEILPTIPPTVTPTDIPTFAPTNPPTVPLIWKPRGQVLLGDAAGDRLGTSLVLSADAKILAVGAPGDFNNDNNKEGYVKVYRINDDGGNWTRLGQTIYGEEIGDKLGWDVDLSRGGNILAIGAPGRYRLNDRTGYVRVCYLEGDDSSSFSWEKLGEDIIGEENGDEFGESVSLSDDGKSIAIGADDNDGSGDFSGSVGIFHFEDNTTSWEKIGRIDGEGANDHSGLSVSLSGTTVAIGAPFNDHNGEDSGHVRVHQLNSDGSSWEQLGSDFDGYEKNDFFGTSVALSSDGKTLAIGAPANWNIEEEGLLGYVRVFYLNDDTSTWDQVGQDIHGESSGDFFGFSLALSADGKTLAIGAYGNDGNGDGSGHVRVYRIYDAGWTKLGDDIDGESSFDQSGRSLSLSANGNTLAIGSMGRYEEDPGRVRVFTIE